MGEGSNATPTAWQLKDYGSGTANAGFYAKLSLPNSQVSHDQSEFETEIRNGFPQGFRIGSSPLLLSKVSFSEAQKYKRALIRAMAKKLFLVLAWAFYLQSLFLLTP